MWIEENIYINTKRISNVQEFFKTGLSFVAFVKPKTVYGDFSVFRNFNLGESFFFSNFTDSCPNFFNVHEITSSEVYHVTTKVAICFDKNLTIPIFVGIMIAITTTKVAKKR